jgi:hypothetical protein
MRRQRPHGDWREVGGGALEAEGEDPSGCRYVVRVERKTRDKPWFLLSDRMCFDGTNWHPVGTERPFDSLHVAKVAGQVRLLTYARCIVWQPTKQ